MKLEHSLTPNGGRPVPVFVEIKDNSVVVCVGDYSTEFDVGLSGIDISVGDANGDLWEESFSEEEDEEVEEETLCPCCWGSEKTLSAQWGNLVHNRCRGCGMDYIIPQ